MGTTAFGPMSSACRHRWVMGPLLTPIERKALADLVVRAGGTEEAFVEKEFLGDNPGEVWLTAYSGFEFTEVLPLTFAFAARERDMGLEGTSLGDEPAKLGRRGDALLK